MKRTILLITLFSLLLVILPAGLSAKIGVGIGTGKIRIDEKLKPGMIYELPSISVLNTGDEASEYTVSVAYHYKQPQLRPKEDWFIFTPHTFTLKRGQVQTVGIKLNLPLRVAPGEYFAYLEAHPSKKIQDGKTSVGVAAAAKLYFTVIPANIFQSIYYKIVTFWNVYAPWPKRILFVVCIAGFVIILKRFFNIQINVKK